LFEIYLIGILVTFFLGCASFVLLNEPVECEIIAILVVICMIWPMALFFIFCVLLIQSIVKSIQYLQNKIHIQQGKN